jgi:hypothetical protein
MGIENRQYPRQEIALKVSIETGNSVPIECRLSDLSQSGARLVVGDSGSVPEEFVLALSSDLRRWCRVVWRSGQNVGVHFDRRSLDSRHSGEPRQKRFAMVKCPRTQRTISTGVRVSTKEEIWLLPNVRRFAQCPHCGIVHGWSINEATL